MSLLRALTASVAALLMAAAPAGAAQFTVDREDDTAAPGSFACSEVTPDDCPLRAAIEKADGLPGKDAIVFADAVRTIHVTEAGLVVSDPVSMADQQGDVEIRWEAGAAVPGPMLLLAAAAATPPPVGAAGSELRRLAFTGAGGLGSLVRVEAADPAISTTLDQLTFTDAAAAALEIGGSARSIEVIQPSVSGAGGAGILVEGAASDVEVSGGSVQGSGGDGIAVTGTAQGVTVSGTSLTGNTGDGLDASGGASGVTLTSGAAFMNQGFGVRVNGAQAVLVTRTPIYGNALGPIRLEGGGNAGIGAPTGLRVGPRQADGTLPLTGTTTVPGTIEVFSGNPFAASPTSFLASFSAPGGSFAYVPSPEPAPGASFAVTLTGPGGYTSEFSNVAVVPGDVFSPFLLGGVAVSTTEVRVQPSEPLDPSSLQPGDFQLEMAGEARTITRVTAAPDGSSITLTSSGWSSGEAGHVSLSGPGVVADVAGNVNTAVARVRVAAAPGDFIAPFVSSLAIRPRTICLTRGRGCARPGGTVSFVTSELGRGRWVIMRGNRRLGERIFRTDAGRNDVRLDGRVRGRKLRAGRYRLLMYTRDDVGNETPEPAIRLFSVKRTARR